MSMPFIAEIRLLPYSFAPRAWANCGGQLMPLSQNTALFSLLGINYGGDGKTSFGIPNLQGRAPLHSGNSTGPGLSSYDLGQADGNNTISLIQTEMPAHTHQMMAAFEPPNGLLSVASNTTYIANAQGVQAYLPEFTGQGATALSFQAVQSAGQGLPHENRQPLLAIRFCICVSGDYPARN